MLRKNFPGRIQARRESAIRRFHEAVKTIQEALKGIEKDQKSKTLSEELKVTARTHGAYLIEKLARLKVCIEKTEAAFKSNLPPGVYATDTKPA